MLKTVELDQILYIILSGITHGEGLNFNRAVLFLAWERRNELRVSRSAGPANGEEAHRIWEGIKAEQLSLESLFDRYSTSSGQPQFLTTQLIDFSLKLNEAESYDEVAFRNDSQNSSDKRTYGLSGVIGHCVATRQPFFINGDDIVYHTFTHEELKFRNFACVPIFLQGEVFGVILTDNFYNSRVIQKDEMRGLSNVANLASIALERAMLYRRLKEMAEVDGLTGVFNRRYYEQHLHEEFIRSKRLGRSLAMIVFDIDLFKKCNDTYGHECGDRVLMQFAELLKTNTREEDMVARYGGEEFVVLLTGESTPEGAKSAAEKIRHLVEGTGFADFREGLVTVSAGVSVVGPEDDFGQLFSRADQALYEAKNSGRNCVKVYGG